MAPASLTTSTTAMGQLVAASEATETSISIPSLITLDVGAVVEAAISAIPGLRGTELMATKEEVEAAEGLCVALVGHALRRMAGTAELAV